MRLNTINILTGEVFGKLTVIRELDPYVSPRGKRRRRFECRCECSNITGVLMGHLRGGKIKSCGCIKREMDKNRKALTDIPINTHFGLWKVIKEAPSRVLEGKKHRLFCCRCECGVRRDVLGVSLRKGVSKNCGCARLAKLKSGIKPIIHDLKSGQKFGKWNVVKLSKTKVYSSGQSHRIVSCKCECGTERDVKLQYLVQGYSRSCGCAPVDSSSSKGESELEVFLREELPQDATIMRNDRSILKGLEIDLYLPQYKLGIEYHGLYWHSELRQKTNTLHFRKRELAEKAGIQLIQIYEDEWSGKKELLKSTIRRILGLTDIKYYAEKLNISVVENRVAQDFLKENHLMGTFQTGRNIGLYTKEGMLVQLFTYQLREAKHVLNCSRICSLKNTLVVGGVSRLLKHVLRSHLEIKKIVSVVDLRYVTENSLKVMGFGLEKITLGFKWTNFKGTFNRLKCRANMDSRGMTQTQHAEEQGWYKIWDAGQAKFEKILE